MGIARVSSSGPRASCLALPPHPLPGPSLSREDPSDTTATAPCPVVASVSHRSRASWHPRDPVSARRSGPYPGVRLELGMRCCRAMEASSMSRRASPERRSGSEMASRVPPAPPRSSQLRSQAASCSAGGRMRKLGSQARPTGSRTAREQGGVNLPGARPRARVEAAAAPSPWSSSPLRRAALALSRCPASPAAATLLPRPP